MKNFIKSNLFFCVVDIIAFLVVVVCVELFHMWEINPTLAWTLLGVTMLFNMYTTHRLTK